MHILSRWWDILASWWDMLHRIEERFTPSRNSKNNYPNLETGEGLETEEPTLPLHLDDRYELVPMAGPSRLT